MFDSDTIFFHKSYNPTLLCLVFLSSVSGELLPLFFSSCTEFLINHTKPCLICSKLILRLLLPAPNSCRWGQPLWICVSTCNMFLWSLCSKLSLFQSPIIKLTQDALKEPVEIKFLWVCSLVATNLKSIACRINFSLLLRGFSVE